MEQYFNLGTSPYRELERSQLIKCSFSLNHQCGCTSISLKEYKDSSDRTNIRQLHHFSLQEHRDYGERDDTLHV